MARLFTMPQAVRVNSAGLPYAGAKINFYLTGTTTPTDTYQESSLTTTHANPVVANAAGQFAAIYLDPSITYKVVITDSSNNTLDTVDPVSVPITGADIAITDTGGYFAGTEVETILADIGANYAKKSAANTWTQDQTFSGADLLMADNLVARPEIKDFGITHNAVLQSPSGTIDFDCSTGNSFYHLLTANISTMTLSNPSPTGKFCQITIVIKQDGAGGAYTVAWPSSVKWVSATAPVISTGNNAVDIVTLFTIDEGTNWYGNFAQAYA